MDYSTQYTQIQDTLDKCTTLQTTYNHPTTVENQFPAVIYFPADIENSFATVADNQKIYRWTLYVVVSAEQKDISVVYPTILADAVDDVINQFDADWGDTNNGHRASVLVDSGTWGVNETENRKIAFAELNLRIKVNTTN